VKAVTTGNDNETSKETNETVMAAKKTFTNGGKKPIREIKKIISNGGECNE